MTIRRTLYPGFQDALCPVQPPASLEWLGIFDSEGFPGRKSVRLVRPRILPSNYRRGVSILPLLSFEPLGAGNPPNTPPRNPYFAPSTFPTNHSQAPSSPSRI